MWPIRCQNGDTLRAGRASLQADEYRVHRFVMQAALIRVKDDRGNHQAQQQGPDQCGQGSRGATVQPGDVDSGDTMANAVAQGSNQQDLLHREDGQGGPGISGEGKVADEQGNSPINADAKDARPRAGNRTRA